MKSDQSDIHFSSKRLFALCRKESLQIVRDPSSLLISLVIPVLLLIVFGYGINLDSSALRIGIVLEDTSAQARRFADVFAGSRFVRTTVSEHREELVRLMQAGKIRGMVIIPVDFSRQLEREDSLASIQVITDGSEPNTATFVQGYVSGIWQVWQEQRAQDLAQPPAAAIRVENRFWFNPAAESINYIIPGAISIVMTVVGAILTSLVIAREWERGTMEALLSTQITRAELLLSKFLPYYVLGIVALVVCMVMSALVFRVPFRGSYFMLWLVSSLFLANTLGLGLLLSTITRNQFNAAQAALNAAFLPAVMLSGFVFEIDSMPALVRGVTYVIPARYYVSAVRNLFLAGDIPEVLAVNCVLLLLTAVLFIGATTVKTKLRLE